MRARRSVANETSKDARGPLRSPANAASEESETQRSSLDSLIEPCSYTEKRFVLALLDTGDYAQAAARAPWQDERTVADALGREHIRKALMTLAPLLPDARKAQRILAPYAMSRLARTLDSGSEAQATQAALRVLEANGVGAKDSGNAAAEALRMLASEAARRRREIPPAPAPTLEVLPRRDEP